MIPVLFCDTGSFPGVQDFFELVQVLYGDIQELMGSYKPCIAAYSRPSGYTNPIFEHTGVPSRSEKTKSDMQEFFAPKQVLYGCIQGDSNLYSVYMTFSHFLFHR